MNPLKWNLGSQIVSVGAVIGAMVAIITGLPVLADSIPYATKSFVLAQFTVQSATRNADRRDQLDFEITVERGQLYALQQQLSQNSDTASLIGKLTDDIAAKQKEMEFLTCLLRAQGSCTYSVN